MLQQTMERWGGTAAAQEGHWVNYVRSSRVCYRYLNIQIGCSADLQVSSQELGWLYTNQEAHEQLIDPESHRRFLNSFYIKRYPGSFARGLAYQDDPSMNKCRISGTTASLAGLESGEENAVERVLLMYSICFSSGGIPVLNLGDEVCASASSVGKKGRNCQLINFILSS